MLNILNMTRAEYEEIRPRLVEILAENAPIHAPKLHEKYMNELGLDKRDASDCLWRMQDDGYLHVRYDLRIEVGEFAKSASA